MLNGPATTTRTCEIESNRQRSKSKPRLPLLLSPLPLFRNNTNKKATIAFSFTVVLISHKIHFAPTRLFHDGEKPSGGFFSKNRKFYAGFPERYPKASKHSMLATSC